MNWKQHYVIYIKCTMITLSASVETNEGDVLLYIPIPHTVRLSFMQVWFTVVKEHHPPVVPETLGYLLILLKEPNSFLLLTLLSLLAAVYDLGKESITIVCIFSIISGLKSPLQSLNSISSLLATNAP